MDMKSCTAGHLALICLSFALLAGATVQEAGKEIRFVSNLLKVWGVDDGHKVVVVAEGSYEDLDLRSFESHIVILAGSKPPVRRNIAAGEPFLAVERSEGHLAWNASFISQLLAVPSINRGSQLLEAVTGRPLFPIRLSVADLRGAYAVFDVSIGRISLSHTLMQKLTEETMPERISKVLGSFVDALFHQFSLLLGIASAADAPNYSTWSSLFSTAAPAAASIALASHIPLWFCIACPIVLGMLFPLIFNFGFGTAAELVCQHYNLPIEECNDLWYGAFAVAMVLSFASAIPIVYICRLSECGRRTLAALL